MKYTAHIVSHSHWDREWYLPYEQHHMRLIELIDDILDKIDEDEAFKSFHLDGQTICIDDYLEVKPNNRERLFKAIKDGKIKVGPWYILQDAFLTSAEANVRNMQIGHKMALAIGDVTKVGYYPDTFGIYGQAAQILKLSGIDNMFFGRGVSPTGFNNEVAESFSSKYSELFIKSPDESEVLGILFANWYSNGNEIPTQLDGAKAWWDQKLADSKKFAQTSHLLYMNGCDHQPLQKDLTTGIDLANSLYDDVEFVHSSLEEYLVAVRENLDESTLSCVTGELRSQNTDGYYTLVNTASARLYQKQENVEIQNLLEKFAEPLSAMLKDANQYPHEMLDYTWKKLMQNHPHDSICGCSVDSVHRSMDARFEDAKESAKFLITDALLNYRACANTVEIKDNAFTVINPLAIDYNRAQKVVLDYDRAYFKDMYFNDCRKTMEVLELGELGLFDLDGNQYPCVITDLGAQFDYELPKDGFRVPFYARRIEVTFNDNIEAFSHKSFIVKPATPLNLAVVNPRVNVLENDHIKVTINDDATLNILNKDANITYNNLMKFEDLGDVGNEYMYGNVKGDQAIHINDDVVITTIDDGITQGRVINCSIDLPVSATEDLQDEHRVLKAFYDRDAKRSNDLVTMPLTITLTLDQNDLGLTCNVKFVNEAMDHRLRVLFTTDRQAELVAADSVFEVAMRSTVPSEHWKHVENDEHQAKFVSLHDELTIANMGLCEYAVLNQNTLAVTILRACGELGDWGHFETPEAQCLRPFDVSFKIYVHDKKDKYQVYNQCHNDFITIPYVQLNKEQEGVVPLNKKYFNFTKDDALSVTSIKRNQGDDVVLRMFNMSGDEAMFDLDCPFVKTDLLETNRLNSDNNNVNPYEIYSLLMDKE